MNTLEQMDEVLGAPADGESRMILRGREEDLKKKICELLETNFSVTIWTKGWTEEEIIAESRMLEEWRIVWCWDEMMEAFLCFRSEEDMMGFYQKLAEEYPSVEFDFVGKAKQ